MRNLSVTVAPLLFLFACVAEPPPMPAPVDLGPQGLTIGQHDNDHVAGLFVQGTSRVTFASTMTQEQRADVIIMIGDKRIHVDIDYKLGHADHDAGGNTFSLEEISLVQTAAVALEEYMPTGQERTRAEDSVTQQLALMAIAPSDIAIDKFEITQDRSIVCLASCSCQTQYIGSGYYRQAGRGNSCTGGSGNGCKGRCGAGCASDLSGNYTQDCAKHDYGLGSFAAASDDYAFANCWC